MDAQGRIPCTLEDRKIFKKIAANEERTMTDLFHKWIEDYMNDRGK